MAAGGINLESSVGIECCEISIGSTSYVGANLFARKRLIMRINSHLQSGRQRFLGSNIQQFSCLLRIEVDLCDQRFEIREFGFIAQFMQEFHPQMPAINALGEVE